MINFNSVIQTSDRDFQSKLEIKLIKIHYWNDISYKWV